MSAIVQPIDFSKTALAPHYGAFYAKILDNVFTPSECADLIALATSTDDWKPAMMSAEAQEQTVHSEFRHSERILRYDAETADRVYERLRPLVEDIHEISPQGQWGAITGKLGRKQGPTWKIIGVNRRLSFLRYGPGHFFKRHCDGLVDQDDGARKSFVTLHVYLNEEADQAGGETRFWSPNKKDYIDVKPKIGRVLVFQQRMLIHSGEEVTSGMKYTLRSEFMFEQA